MTPSILNVFQKSSATATVAGPGVQRLMEMVAVLKNGLPVPGVTAQLVWSSVDTRQLKISAAANAVPTKDCTLQFIDSNDGYRLNLDAAIGRVNVYAYQLPVLYEPWGGCRWYAGSQVRIRGKGNPGQLYEFRLLPNYTNIPRAMPDANGDILIPFVPSGNLPDSDQYTLEMYTTGVGGPDYHKIVSPNFSIRHEILTPNITSVSRSVPSNLTIRQRIDIKGTNLSPRSAGTETARVLLDYGEYRYEVDAVRLGPNWFYFIYPGELSKRILWRGSNTKYVGVQLVLNNTNPSNKINIAIEKDFGTPTGLSPSVHKDHSGVLGNKGDDWFTVPAASRQPPPPAPPNIVYVVDHADIFHTNTSNSNVSVVTSQNDLAAGQQVQVHWWHNAGNNASYTLTWKYRATYPIDESRVR